MAGKPLFPDPTDPKNICRMVLCEVAGDLDEMAKTLCMPDYRAKFGCLKCFHEKRLLDDFTVSARIRTHQWLLTAAEASFSFHEIASDTDVDELRKIAHHKHKKGGVIVKARNTDIWPNLKIGDRIEPALEGHPDIWHGESICHYALEKRRFLVHRRQKNGLLNISRLFEVPGVSRGIPGL
eukprot:368327-Pyramimonas_sp.AAC.1